MDEYYEDDDYSLDDNNFNVGISKEQILNFFIYKIGELLRKRRKKMDEFKLKNNIQKNIQNLSINEGKIIYQSLKEFFEIKNNNIEIAKDIINSLSNQNENLLIKNLKLLYTKKKIYEINNFFCRKNKSFIISELFYKGRNSRITIKNKYIRN